MSKINSRLISLRAAMIKHHIDAIIIPSADRHQSEYVPTCWMDRTWISGFTGSAGIVIITHTEATLWTDSRYFQQAERELATSEFVLKRQVVRSEPEHLVWLKDQLDDKARIALNYWNFTPAQINQIKNVVSLSDEHLVDCDLISDIWVDRPPLPQEEIFVFDIKYAGTSVQDKLATVQSKMKIYKADHYIITGLDEIAYLLNLRGSDVDFNPIFIAYLIVSTSGVKLYVDSSKLTNPAALQLQDAEITVCSYLSISTDVAALKGNVLVDNSLVNSKLIDLLDQAHIVSQDSIVHNMKGVKTHIELNHWRNAMIKDGVALTHAFYWLEKTLEERTVSEADFADQIAYFRSQQDGYRGESFPAIVGYNANGALNHYRPIHGECADIHKSGILLCDSGGQYLDGTTDITRTIALSPPSKTQKEHFTMVLKGMIHVSKATFPAKTSGGQLDILARQFLWAEGLDYGHGTGHGVGYYLNVHEGPHSISAPYTTKGRKPLVPGMMMSNEPGYYIDDEYGIRIENLIAVTPAKYDNFLKFDTYTLFPIDQALMDETRLDAGEKAWINKYHHEVFQALSPFLEGEMKNWLERKCKPLN